MGSTEGGLVVSDALLTTLWMAMIVGLMVIYGIFAVIGYSKRKDTV